MSHISFFTFASIKVSINFLVLALTKASQSTEYYHDWQVIGSSSGAAGSSGGARADATDAATDAAEDQEDESTKVEIEVEVREDEDPANYDYPPMDSATEAAWSSVYPEDKARSVPVVALNLFFIPSSFLPFIFAGGN